MIHSRKIQLRIVGLMSIPMLVCLFFAPIENYPLTLLAFGVLALGVILLWKAAEPPILMLVVIYQWLQISTKTIHADLLGVGLDDMLIDGSFGASHPSMGALGEATALSLLGLTALIIGMRFGQRHRFGRRALPDQGIAETTATAHRQPLLLATGGYIVFSALLKSIQPSLPGGLIQIILPLIEIKWAFIFALACAILRERKGYVWLVLICGVEIVLGFAAYFSAWKEVILILALAYFFCRPSFDMKRVLAGSAIIVLGLGLAVFWTAIKSDQRTFLNRDTGMQIVDRSTTESLVNALELAATTDWEDYTEAVDHLARRIAYVDFFANALIHVPAVRQHEYGRLWSTAVTHVLTPRILFPDKPPLQSDSELTMQYTGLFLASSHEGTSISLGYMAESYIDFGRIGMMIPILLWGVILGFSIRFLVNRFGATDLVWGSAIVVALNSLIFEIALVKMVGGTLMSLIVIHLFLRFAWPQLLPRLYSDRVPS